MFTTIEDVQFWCQKILPTVYDDSLSYYQAVTRLKNIVNEMIQAVNVLGASNVELSAKYEECTKELEALQKQMQDFIDGYTVADGSVTINKLAGDVMTHINSLVVDSVKDVAKFVWFGLDDDGHFIAVIPDSWCGIDFSTTDDGELMLRY